MKSERQSAVLTLMSFKSCEVALQLQSLMRLSLQPGLIKLLSASAQTVITKREAVCECVCETDF